MEQFLSTRSVDQSKPEEIKRSAQLKQRLIPLLAQAGLEVVPPINVDAQPGAYTSPSQVIVGAADSPQGPPACAVQVGIEYDTNEKEFSGNKDFAAAIPFVFGLKDSLRDGKLYQSVGNGLMHMEGLLAIYGFRFRRDDLSAGATTIRAVYDYVCGQIVPRLHLLKRTEPDTHEANNTATAPRRQLQTNENYI